MLACIWDDHLIFTGWWGGVGWDGVGMGAAEILYRDKIFITATKADIILFKAMSLNLS